MKVMRQLFWGDDNILCLDYYDAIQLLSLQFVEINIVKS